MKTCYFHTPEHLDITVELRQNTDKDGYQVMGWELCIEPPPGFTFGKPTADVLSDGNINVEFTADC
jgi:hypothetical protein